MKEQENDNRHEGVFVEIEKVCKICKKLRCYEHCQETKDGKHEPDPASIAPADGAGRNRGTDWIIDVTCKRCRVSGSMKIDPKDIQFE